MKIKSPNYFLFYLFIYFFSEHANIMVLARLCQEYQVDWLSNQIEKFLSIVKLTNIDSILEYLQISMRMGFASKVEDHLLRTRPILSTFPMIRKKPFFVTLDRQIQIRIANKFLNLLFQEKNTKIRTCLTYEVGNGLSCYLIKCIEQQQPQQQQQHQKQQQKQKKQQQKQQKQQKKKKINKYI